MSFTIFAGFKIAFYVEKVVAFGGARSIDWL